jgi:cysteine desulfurase/selenocysteine lyase
MRHYRADFPILEQTVNGKPLVYLDNAATSQKPIAVLDTLDTYYREYNANVHRGIHTLSERATDAYEAARTKIARFINAKSPTEVIYTRNTSESINLVAHSWAAKYLKAGDVILLSEMEHHSNLVPWQMLSQRMGIQLRFVSVTDEGLLDLSDLDALLAGVRLVSLMHVSNVLGTINPIARIAEAAHAVGALMLVDGAQSVPNMPIDVQALGADFFAFSGHKMCAPTGIGVLWGRAELLDAMDPFLGGGDMISEVFLDHSTYAELPHKFEAGTPSIAQAIGLGAAVDYLSAIGMTQIEAYERELTALALEKLATIEELHVHGPQTGRGGAISFTVKGIHPHDLSTILDQEGVAIRAGSHCAQPLMRRLCVPMTARASLYFYNVPEEIDVLVGALHKAQEVFGYVA